MELRTAGSRIRIGPIRVDYRGPRRAITSDGLPIPHLPQDWPVPAGTLVSVGVESASPEGIATTRISRLQHLGVCYSKSPRDFLTLASASR